MSGFSKDPQFEIIAMAGEWEEEDGQDDTDAPDETPDETPDSEETE